MDGYNLLIEQSKDRVCGHSTADEGPSFKDQVRDTENYIDIETIPMNIVCLQDDNDIKPPYAVIEKNSISSVYANNDGKVVIAPDDGLELEKRKVNYEVDDDRRNRNHDDVTSAQSDERDNVTDNHVSGQIVDEHDRKITSDSQIGAIYVYPPSQSRTDDNELYSGMDDVENDTNTNVTSRIMLQDDTGESLLRTPDIPVQNNEINPAVTVAHPVKDAFLAPFTVPATPIQSERQFWARIVVAAIVLNSLLVTGVVVAGFCVSGACSSSTNESQQSDFSKRDIVTGDAPGCSEIAPSGTPSAAPSSLPTSPSVSPTPEPTGTQLDDTELSDSPLMVPVFSPIFIPVAPVTSNDATTAHPLGQTQTTPTAEPNTYVPSDTSTILATMRFTLAMPVSPTPRPYDENTPRPYDEIAPTEANTYVPSDASSTGGTSDASFIGGTYVVSASLGWATFGPTVVTVPAPPSVSPSPTTFATTIGTPIVTVPAPPSVSPSPTTFATFGASDIPSDASSTGGTTTVTAYLQPAGPAPPSVSPSPTIFATSAPKTYVPTTTDEKTNTNFPNLYDPTYVPTRTPHAPDKGSFSPFTPPTSKQSNEDSSIPIWIFILVAVVLEFGIVSSLVVYYRRWKQQRIQLQSSISSSSTNEAGTEEIPSVTTPRKDTFNV